MDSKAELLITDILRRMINHPEDLKIVRTLDAQGVLLTLSSNPLDAGLIIGRNGDTLNSIRQLARMVGNTQRETVFVVYQDHRGEYLKPKQGG